MSGFDLLLDGLQVTDEGWKGGAGVKASDRDCFVIFKGGL